MTHSFPTRRSSDLGAFGVKFDQAVHVRTLGYFNIPFNGVLRRFGILKYPKEATSDILMSEGSAPGRAVSRCDLSIITPGVIESLTACATSPRMRSHGSRIRRPRPSKVGVGPGVYGRFRGRDRHVVPKRSEEHTSELQSLMRISY